MILFCKSIRAQVSLVEQHPGFGGSTPRVWWIDTQKTARQPAAQGRQRGSQRRDVSTTPSPPRRQPAAAPSFPRRRLRRQGASGCQLICLPVCLLVCLPACLPACFFLHGRRRVYTMSCMRRATMFNYFVCGPSQRATKWLESQNGVKVKMV